MTSSLPQITVVICTFNRCERLRRALVAFTSATPPSVHWELLIVDNNSTDQTREVVEGFRDRLPVQYAFERKQGLSNARNCALAAARGQHILFTDDDVLIDKAWLTEYSGAFERWPDAGYFGGRVLPFYPSGKPSWLHDESIALLSGLLVRFAPHTETRMFAAIDPTPYGASFALHRRCAQAVGEFRADLGVNGNIPGRGEETDFLSRAIALGWRGLYVHDAVALHETDPRRLTLSYMYRFGVQCGIAAAKVGGSPSNSSWFHATGFAIRGILQLLRGRGDRARQCLINIGIIAGLHAKTVVD